MSTLDAITIIGLVNITGTEGNVIIASAQAFGLSLVQEYTSITLVIAIIIGLYSGII